MPSKTRYNIARDHNQSKEWTLNKQDILNAMSNTNKFINRVKNKFINAH